MDRPISYRPQPVVPKGAAEDDSQSIKYCQLCLDPPSLPEVLCGSCKIALCQACFQRHITIQRFALHKSVPYEDMYWCPIHAKRQILYCNDCCEKCCLICANFGFHKGHSILDCDIAAKNSLAKEVKETEDLREKVYEKMLAAMEAVQSQLQALNAFEAEGCDKIREKAEERRKETNCMIEKTKEELKRLFALNGGNSIQEMEKVKAKLREMESHCEDERTQPPDFSLLLATSFATKQGMSATPSAPDSDQSFPLTTDEEVVAGRIHIQQNAQNYVLSDLQLSEEEINSERGEVLDDLVSEGPVYIYTLCNDSDRVIRLDMKTEVWDIKAADRTWPKFCNFTQIATDELIITGGGHIPSKRTYILDLNTFRSSEQTQMLTPRNHHGLIKIGEGVLAIGGICKHIQVKCELFDLAGKTWCDVAPLNHARAAMGCCEMREQVFVFGGWDGHKEISSIEKFSIRGGRWIHLPLALPVASQCNAVMYEEKILVFAFKPGKVYEVKEDSVTEFGSITNEAWCRPELRLYRNVVYSFRSGELKVLKYNLLEGRFTVLNIEE